MKFEGYPARVPERVKDEEEKEDEGDAEGARSRRSAKASSCVWKQFAPTSISPSRRRVTPKRRW